MRPRKKREFQSSELVRAFAKIHGFEDKLLALDIRTFLETYLDESLYGEILSVNFSGGTVTIKIASPLMKNDFRLRKGFFLKKIQQKFGEQGVTDLQIL